MAETLGPKRPSDRKRYLLLLLPPLLVAVALAGVLVFFSSPDSRQELDDDLCALEPDESAGRAVFLLDFRKPMDEANLSLPGELLHDVSLGLSADTELRVFALAADPRAPRFPLDRLCKPYDNADLQIGTAKDQRNTLRDCDDLPAQLPASLREAADRFCDRRDALQNRVDALARNQPEMPVANSHLIEALEDTAMELSEGSGPRTIYVFSDMMQHAAWYSHLDLEWTDWHFADFTANRAAQTGRMGRRPSAANLAVQVYYSPRLDLTEHPRPKRAHQAFWQEYFAGAQLTFNEQPPLPAYAAEPLMDRLTPEELAALERERIEKERAEAARMLAEVQRERAVLEEELRKIAEERARTTVAPKAQPQRAAQLRRQQRSLADQREQLDVRQAEIGEIAAEEPAEVETPPPAQIAEQRTVPETAEPRTVASGPTVPEAVVASDVPVTEVVEPAASVSDDPSAAEPIGQLALASDRSATTDLPPCTATLLPRFLAQAARDIYPGRRRMNYGSATIAIRYALDEQGATVNDEISVIPEQSSAARPRSFDLFARTAMQVVRNWVFEFGDDGTCRKRQERSIKFQFRYN